MSLETNHAAAGTAATTARGEVKQEWYKKPTSLHFAIAVGVIIVALIINHSFTFNLFWKLLLGGALIFGGKKLSPSKSFLGLWGKVLMGIGGVMIIIALLNSNVRTAAEKSVTWIDATLGSVGDPSAPTATFSSSKQPPVIYVEVDMMTWTYNQSETIPMGLSSIAILKIPGTVVGKDQYGNYGCPEAKKLNGLFPVMFEVPYGNRTDNVQLTLTNETKKKLAELNVASIDVTFTLTKGPMFGESPCKFFQEKK
jgi:hypothetical protein